MPVRSSDRHQVMGHTGLETTGAEGGADVHIITRLELEDAEPADLDVRCFGRCEDEGVCSGQRLHNRTGYNVSDDFNAVEMSEVPRPEFTIDWLPAQC